MRVKRNFKILSSFSMFLKKKGSNGLGPINSKRKLQTRRGKRIAEIINNTPFERNVSTIISKLAPEEKRYRVCDQCFYIDRNRCGICSRCFYVVKRNILSIPEFKCELPIHCDCCRRGIVCSQSIEKARIALSHIFETKFVTISNRKEHKKRIRPFFLDASHFTKPLNWKVDPNKKIKCCMDCGSFAHFGYQHRTNSYSDRLRQRPFLSCPCEAQNQRQVTIAERDRIIEKARE